MPQFFAELEQVNWINRRYDALYMARSITLTQNKEENMISRKEYSEHMRQLVDLVAAILRRVKNEKNKSLTDRSS